MTEKIVSPSGIPYQDVMRLFKRDSPAPQFEVGIMFVLRVQCIQT